MSIKIITDSAVDLPSEIINKYDIKLVPFLVHLGEKEYLDGKTIAPVDIFNGMREGKVYKTAQVPPSRFRKIFSEYAKTEDSYIYIAFSSKLSGTYQSAVLTKNQMLEDYPGLDIEILDTKCASTGMGLIVYKAAQMVRVGKEKSEIIEMINFYSRYMEHIFTVDDLEYLYRGGRVSRATAFVGGLLNIKPVLGIKDGELVSITKVRGRKKLFKKMMDLMDERGTNLVNQIIGISHGDDPEGAETLKKMIKEKFGSKKFIINNIGGAIGAHAGPNTLAIFFLNKQPERWL